MVTLDADTILARHTITNLVRHFALDCAGTLGAVAGVVRVGNRTRNLLTRWQALEYLTQIGVERSAHDALGAISIVPGACAAWRKEAITGVGGYSSTTLAEDCDLSLSLHRAGWRITQDDQAPAYTEAPEDVDSLLAQRIRWTYGTLQAIYKHRTLLFDRRHGWLGWFVLPNYVLSIVVPVVFLPFVVIMGVVLVREQGPAVLGMYFMIFLAVHMIIASVGLMLMRERPHHLLVVPVYRIVFEPLRAYLLYTSVLMALKGVRAGWNKLQRTGSMDAVFDSVDSADAVIDLRDVPAQHGAPSRVTIDPAATEPSSGGLCWEPAMSILTTPRQLQGGTVIDLTDRGSEPPEVRVEPAVSAADGRDRYLDSLRAVALIGLVTYHLFGWLWLPAVFPSMGIMFAMAGSLVAASLDRSPGNPWRVLAKRMRRLLLPLWAFGIVLVPVMLWHGWTVTEVAGTPLRWDTLWLWVLPLADPPGSAWGSDWVLPLWYVRACLWFLLLSPAFLWLFRHWPRRVIALPMVTLILATLGVLTLSDLSGGVILSMSIYGACWMTGFAHHDGMLRRARRSVVVAGGLALMVAGFMWAKANPDPFSGPNIDDIPLSNALYSLGFVLILLRFYPDLSWMARRPVLDKLVSMINARAMTIYLWSNVAVFCAYALADSWSVTANGDTDSVGGRVQAYVITWVCIAVAIVAFGWVEDLAARRPVRFNPWPGSADEGQAAARSTAVTRPASWVTTAAPMVAWARQRLPEPTWWPRDRVTNLLLGSAGVLLVAAAFAGSMAHDGASTHVVTGDRPSKYAEQPLVEAPRPANLARPDGETFQPVEKVKRILTGDPDPATTSPGVPAQARMKAAVPRTQYSAPAPIARPLPKKATGATVSTTRVTPSPSATTTPAPSPSASPVGTTTAPTPTTTGSPTTTQRTPTASTDARASGASSPAP